MNKLMTKQLVVALAVILGLLSIWGLIDAPEAQAQGRQSWSTNISATVLSYNDATNSPVVVNARTDSQIPQYLHVTAPGPGAIAYKLSNILTTNEVATLGGRIAAGASAVIPLGDGYSGAVSMRFVDVETNLANTVYIYITGN